MTGEAWTPASGASDPVAHLYGLSSAEFAHILGAFPLVFADDAAGRARKAGLLAGYEKMRE